MISKNVLTDTGYWIALYHTKDAFHQEAIDKFDEIRDCRILFPWPIFYEVLRTKFVKNKVVALNFEEHLKTLSINRIDDSPYREDALDDTIRLSAIGKRNISLADMVIRHVLQDDRWKIDYLITFNEKDFTDVCKRRRIQINP
jgi:predicted nucleic acid-binding protein